MSEMDPQEELHLLTALARLSFDHMTFNCPGQLHAAGLSALSYAIELLSEYDLVTYESSQFGTWTAKGIELLTNGQRNAIGDESYKNLERYRPAKYWKREWHDRCGHQFQDARDIPVAMNASVRNLLIAIVSMFEVTNEICDANLLDGFSISNPAHGAVAALEKYGLIKIDGNRAVWTDLGSEVMDSPLP